MDVKQSLARFSRKWRFLKNGHRSLHVLPIGVRLRSHTKSHTNKAASFQEEARGTQVGV